jgi:hypothetical protein
VAELKTKPTKKSVEKFINAVPDAQTRADCFTIAGLMEEATRAKPQMWGTSIVGFGVKHYKYASGREGDWPIIGFSPRKQNLTLYAMAGFKDAALMKKLGKHSLTTGCLYIKRLSDVDLPTLKKIIQTAAKQ